MRPARKAAVLTSLGALLAVLLMGCGDESPTEEAAGDATTTETGASADPAGSADGNVATDVACDLPEGLLNRLTVQRQLVRNVASAGGENLDAVQSGDPLDPETFRTVADVLDRLDLSGVTSNPQFDAPEDVIADLRKTADLLQAALDAGTDTADPAWQELTEFFTAEFFARHGASVNYYLTEAGCA